MNVAVSSFAQGQGSVVTPLNIAVLSIADDGVGPSETVLDLADRLLGYGHSLVASVSMAEDDECIRRQVQSWIDEGCIDVVLMLDNSTLSAGDVPPSVILTSDSGADDLYSTLVQDPDFGFVAIVNILAAHQRAA